MTKRIIFSLVIAGCATALAVLLVLKRERISGSGEGVSTSQTKIESLASSDPKSSTGRGTTKRDPNGAPPAPPDSTRASKDLPTTIPLIVEGTLRLVDGSPPTSATVRLARGRGNPFARWECDTIASTATDAQGNYRLKAEAQDEIRLILGGPGLATRIEVLTDENSVAWRIAGGSKELAFRKDLVLQRAETLTGRVADGEGRVVPSAVVRVLPENTSGYREETGVRVTTTTAEGSFRFEDLPAGSAYVAVVHPEMQSWHGAVTLPNDALSVTLKSGGCTAEGEVSLAETGEPISNVSVFALPEDMHGDAFSVGAYPRSITGSEGQFRLEHAPSGKVSFYVVERNLITFPQDQESLKSVELAENETTRGLKFTMSKGFTIRGVVWDAETSDPLAGVSYHRDHRKSGPLDERAITDDSGSYEIQQIQSTSEISISVEKPGYHLVEANGNPSGWISVDLAGETTTTVVRDLRMMRSPVAAGRVVDEFGSGIPRATITLLSRRSMGQPPQVVTEVDGSFAVPARSNERLSLKAEAPGFGAGYVPDQPMSLLNSKEIRLVLSRAVRVSGEVVDAQGGPVLGIRVTADYVPGGKVGPEERNGFSDEVGQVLVDRDGRFTLTGLPAGTVRLRAWYPGGNTLKSEWLELKGGESREGVRLVLPELKAVAGTVVSEKDSRPVIGAKVSARPEHSTTAASGQAVTDADGLFRIEGLDAETSYSVTAEHEKFEEKKSDGVFPGGDALDLRLAPQNEVPLLVRVLDGETNAPIAEAMLKCQGNIAKEIPAEKMERTAPGQFRISGLQAEEYTRVIVSAPGYVGQESGVTIPKDQQTAEITLYLKRGVTVVGRIVSREDRTPRAGLKVHVSNMSYERYESEEIKTGQNGEFRVPNVPSGQCMLLVIAESGGKSERLLSRAVEVPSGVDHDLGTIEVGNGGIVKGVVLQRPHDRPVAGEPVELLVNSHSQNTVTDDQGRFRFEKVPTEVYGIEIMLPKRSQNSQMVPPRDGETKEVVLRVGGATLKGQTVRSGKGESATVRARLGNSLQTQIRNVPSDSEGNFELTDMAPGRWELRAYSRIARNSVGTEYVEIPESGTTNVTVELPDTKVEGRVLSPEGKPAGDVAVRLRRKAVGDPLEDRSGSSNDSAEITRSDGTFEFASVAPGSYLMSARSNQGGYAARVLEIAERDQAQNVELKLAPSEATIISLILNASTGTPLDSTLLRVCRPDGTPVWQGEDDVRRGPDGILRLEKLPAGDLLVIVGGGRYTEALHQVTLEPGETRSFTDLLELAGSFQWSLLKPDGSGLPEVSVRLVPLDAGSEERIRESRTNLTGLWSVSGVRPGTYQATATLPDGRTVSETVTVDIVVQPAVKVTVVE